MISVQISLFNLVFNEFNKSVKIASKSIENSPKVFDVSLVIVSLSSICVILMLEVFNTSLELLPYFMQINSLSIQIIAKEIIYVIEIRCKCSVSIYLI